MFPGGDIEKGKRHEMRWFKKCLDLVRALQLNLDEFR